MSIRARYSGTCPECGESWQPGDEICGRDSDLPYEKREQPTVWRHRFCPDPLAKDHPVCET